MHSTSWMENCGDDPQYQLIDLPISLQSSLKKGYEGYWISDLFEVSNNEGTNYYITMENADSKVVLKSTSGGNWNNFKKLAKL
jgi:hypothetical protein